jgi:hypothetical protein
MSKDDQKKAQANMAYYFKANGSTNMTKGVRGSLRTEWFTQYMILKAREKNGTLTSKTEKTFATNTTKLTTKAHMCMFQLEKEVGPVKAKKWIASGKMQWRPDQVTGDDDEEMREYEVAFDGEKFSEEETQKMMLQSECDESGSKEKIDNALTTFVSFAHGGSSSGDTCDPPPLADGAVTIKKEPGTLPKPTETLTRIQTQITETKQLKPRAEGLKYAEQLVKDMDKLLLTLQKTAKSVEAIVVTPDRVPDETAMTKLMKAIEANDKSFSEVLNWAGRFGIAVQNKRRKKQ